VNALWRRMRGTEIRDVVASTIASLGVVGIACLWAFFVLVRYDPWGYRDKLVGGIVMSLFWIIMFRGALWRIRINDSGIALHGLFLDAMLPWAWIVAVEPMGGALKIRVVGGREFCSYLGMPSLLSVRRGNSSRDRALEMVREYLGRAGVLAVPKDGRRPPSYSAWPVIRQYGVVLAVVLISHGVNYIVTS
jgi:hypothetical protein